ncbi:MAG: hypothetical protein AVDCRST_MAG26-4425 [uncultured Chloroflexia bacterium]|uniref:Methyltransferase type 11 domain-containing protein n=1 Tax=uncultured Chloroflexia bacterium TaxID=1672391 RepID=A0A6J4K4T2_9CHLR|nr:MAG: hypothetical protein AVDCRST_MAG26-4425 [uncultured Chloroflexia bacterium]
MTHRATDLFRVQSLRWRQRLRRLRRPALLGTLRRTAPLSSRWGYDRGTPVDRFYIERFLEQHRNDIRGRVLEIKDSSYTDRFGTQVEARDVLDVDAANPSSTIVADLAAADIVPSDHFDCFVCTQTLGMIYDVRAAVGHAHRILRPGGVLLATLPALSRLDRRLPDYWRFTPASCNLLFGEVFGAANVAVESHGNVLAAIASMSGMAREELSLREMETRDERYPLVVTVRAVKR